MDTLGAATKPRPLPGYILTRGQCRVDGKDNPAPKDGTDTVPSFVDMEVIEGMEGFTNTTSTIIPSQLGMDKREATDTLRELQDITVEYANRMDAGRAGGAVLRRRPGSAGLPVGDSGAVAEEILKKVNELGAILPGLNKLGNAQAQGLLLRFYAHPRLGYWLRGMPLEGMQEAAEEHAERMQGALQDLLAVRGATWLGGFAQVWEDIQELFPTMATEGVHDFEAVSEPPFFQVLHAAMQKVTEVVGKVEEARGAGKN
ncbi:hypothetical protein CYMTET_12405 [Cymbomonas tetramitiformis]|uniref:Uncharacterized protein n=1 Tax=Cymbomonas tetramitiformis TaxID=36881 RepID=A0AAE0GKQ7_9CHLO|nr:hypothetical protein CYMTET_12405 [Cymbomonas tetramitiformis]